jgi:PAS domain S-box-containing protein
VAKIELENEKEGEMGMSPLLVDEGSRLLLDNASEGIALLQDGMMKSVNPSLLKLTSYSERELTSRPFIEFIHPDDRQMVAERHLVRLTGGEVPSAYSFRIVDKQGNSRWVEVNALSIVWHGAPAVLCFLTDVTERRKAEEEIKRSEEKYRNLFENTQDGVEVIDGDTGRVVLANQAAARMFGFDSVDEMVGIDPLDYIPPEDRERVAGMMLEYMFEKDLHKMIEIKVHTKDGRRIWVSGVGVKTEYQGRLAGLVSMRDITEQKETERALRESELQHRLLADNVSDVIWVTDMNLKPTYVSPSVIRLTGYTVMDAMSRTIADLLSPASLEMVQAAFLRALALEENGGPSGPPPLEVELVRKDGSTVWVESTSSFVLDAYGQAVEMMGVLRDVSERRNADIAIRESERRYRLLAENISDVIWVTDMNLRPTYFSPSVTQLMGYSVEEAMAGTVETKLTRESLEAAADAFAAALTVEEREPGRASGEGTLELEFRCKDGSTVWADTTVSFLRDSAGRPVEILGVLRDISERRRVEERLRESLSKLERTMEGTIQVMASIVETKDGYTAGHQRRVSQLAYTIAREMSLSSDRCYAVHTAGLLHDLGKISLPTDILSKPGRLTETEFALIKTHPQAGYEILKNIESFGEIAEIVLQHHERLDGSGYPSGLRHGDIVLEARILAVADVVEAMSSHRPYRPSLGIEKALEEISRNSGTLYDADAVHACLELFNDKGFAFENNDLISEGSSV